MPRKLRLHVPGGLYFIELKHEAPSQPFFVDEADYDAFEQIFANTLRACSAKAFAFSWEPNAIRFAVQIAHVPTSSLVRRLMTAHSKKIRNGRSDADLGTQTRYRALLIDPEAYLFKLVCYVHWAAVLNSPDATVDQHPHSSHPFYSGARAAPWLDTSCVLSPLNHNRSLARYSYIHRIQERPSDEDIKCFEQGGGFDPRILGDDYFTTCLPRHLPVHRSHRTLDQVMYSIAVHCGVTTEEICSKSNEPQLPLARALLAWHATHRHIATLTAVAERLDRKPPTLISLIKHYRPLHQHLFSPGAVPDITPIVSRVATKAAQASPALQEAAPACTTLDQIIQWASRRFGTTPEEICSGNNGTNTPLMRSVIAWQANQRGVATIKEVAQRLRRTPDALYYGIRQFQSSEPQLFSLAAIPQVTLLQPRIAERMQRQTMADRTRCPPAPTVLDSTIVLSQRLRGG